MDFQQLLSSITPQIYENLKTAVEIGKWPNGEKLSQEQRELSLQAVISYETLHLPPEQRTGFIHQKQHTACGNAEDHDADLPIKWQ